MLDVWRITSNQLQLASRDRRVGVILLIIFAPMFLLMLLVHFFLWISGSVCAYALFRLFRGIARKRFVRLLPLYAAGLTGPNARTVRDFAASNGISYPRAHKTVRAMAHLGFFPDLYFNPACDALCMVGSNAPARPAPSVPKETPKKHAAVVVCPACGARNRITGDENCAYCSTPLEYPSNR